MKTAFELNEVVYLPYRVSIIEADKEDNVRYWCEPLFRFAEEGLEIPVIAESEMAKIKLFSEPFKSEMFREDKEN